MAMMMDDLTLDDSDDEGEVPPLLGPGAQAPSQPSKPAPPKPKPAPAPAPAAPAPAPAPKPGANLKPSSGLKKGFLSGGSSSRPNKAAAAGSGSKATSKPSGGGGGGLTELKADATAKAARLQLPEVQSAIAAEQAEAAKLGGGKESWMTPELLQKIAANPLLRKAFTDQRCQGAMAEMQKDPQAAILKYGDQPEMRDFLQAFMKLMGEHFTSLAEKQEAEKAQAAEAQQAAAKANMSPEQRKAQQAADKAMADPEVRAILEDPKIMAILQQMGSGQPLEMERAVRSDPSMVAKLRKLSQVGLINMQWER